jgi:hypothetical protein
LARSHRPVVGIKIHAGLGNQMFKYAAALALAERLDADLVCDIRHYLHADRGDRSLGLNAFGIELNSGWVPPYKPLRSLATQLHLVKTPFRGAERLHVEEGYDPRFHRIENSCVLSGYFQSWRYLTGHEDLVRRTFDVSRLASERTRDWEAAIGEAECPVAVHVRRGDYAASPANIDKFGLLRRDYYDAGRAIIESVAGVGKATYFLFSDDPGAAAAELAGWSRVQQVPGLTAHEELYLMTRCRHFIIANSTFSWWAAWLAQTPDKRVVAPARWFGPAYQYPYSINDRLPPDWLPV